MSDAEIVTLLHKVLWIAMSLSLLALFDELNKPAKTPKRKRRGGSWTTDEARGARLKRKS